MMAMGGLGAAAHGDGDGEPARRCATPAGMSHDGDGRGGRGGRGGHAARGGPTAHEGQEQGHQEHGGGPAARRAGPTGHEGQGHQEHGSGRAERGGHREHAGHHAAGSGECDNNAPAGGTIRERPVRLAAVQARERANASMLLGGDSEDSDHDCDVGRAARAAGGAERKQPAPAAAGARAPKRKHSVESTLTRTPASDTEDCTTASTADEVKAAAPDCHCHAVQEWDCRGACACVRALRRRKPPHLHLTCAGSGAACDGVRMHAFNLCTTSLILK